MYYIYYNNILYHMTMIIICVQPCKLFILVSFPKVATQNSCWVLPYMTHRTKNLFIGSHNCRDWFIWFGHWILRHIRRSGSGNKGNILYNSVMPPYRIMQGWTKRTLVLQLLSNNIKIIIYSGQEWRTIMVKLELQIDQVLELRRSKLNKTI